MYAIGSNLSQAERDELDGAAERRQACRPASSSGRRSCWRPMPAAATRRSPAASGSSGSTVYRTKRRFVEGNLEAALSEEPRPGASRKLTGKEEALLVATACSSPPAGRARWTLELLAGRDGQAHRARRACRARRCAGAWPRTTSSRGARTCGASRRSTANTSPAWRTCSTSMPKRPIPSGRWSASTRARSSSSARCASRSRPSRASSSATTTSTAATAPPTSSSFLDAHRPWRKVKVTERRAAEDFAHCMRELVDVHYPDAERIRVVLDNLSTHSAGALYQAFPPAEARRILRRLEFHYTPKHASWLNMVEIEIGVLRGQCLDRRIDDPNWLVHEIAAWERQRNAAGARIKWMFTTDKARAKMGRAYPDTSKES